MIQRRVTIADGPTGHKRIELDGVDISNAVQGYEIYSDARDTPTVRLDILATNLTVNGEVAKIFLPTETKDLLIDFGWTPPPGDGVS